VNWAYELWTLAATNERERERKRERVRERGRERESPIVVIYLLVRSDRSGVTLVRVLSLKLRSLFQF
jgi:hypothetical protein